MPAFGLDVGSSSIKVISLSGSKNKPRLDAFGLGVNPVGNLETENQQERVQIAEAIKKLVQDAGIKTNKVMISLPESKVFTRVIETPVLSDSELASAITWEAEQYIPVPMSEVQLDYRVLSRPSGSMGKMQVFLVAAPINVVNKMLGLIEMVGLEPEALETETLAVARAFVRDEKALPVMIVHLGANTTDISLVERAVVVFTRSMPTGGNALTRSLASDLGLESSQVEQYKRTYGLDGTQLQGKVRGALLPVFNSIVGEIRKAFHFYSQNRQTKVSRIILSGGGAYLPQATAELAREMGVEVVVGDPFGSVSVDARQKKRIGAIGSVFSVAVGLAMRSL